MVEPEQAAQGNQGIEDIGVAEEKVRGVIAPHADAGGYEFLFGAPAVLAHERNDFLHDVAVIVLVTACTVGGMRAKVRPGLAVKAVHSKQFDLSRFDKPRQPIRHSPVFEVVEASLLRWKDQHGLAVKAVDLELHVMPENRAEPFVIFDLHKNYS